MVEGLARENSYVKAFTPTPIVGHFFYYSGEVRVCMALKAFS